MFLFKNSKIIEMKNTIFGYARTVRFRMIEIIVTYTLIKMHTYLIHTTYRVQKKIKLTHSLLHTDTYKNLKKKLCPMITK